MNLWLNNTVRWYQRQVGFPLRTKGRTSLRLRGFWHRSDAAGGPKAPQRPENCERDKAKAPGRSPRPCARATSTNLACETSTPEPVPGLVALGRHGNASGAVDGTHVGPGDHRAARVRHPPHNRPRVSCARAGIAAAKTTRKKNSRLAFILGLHHRPLSDAVDEFERELIVKALQRTGFNQTKAASLLGTSRRILKYRIEKLKINEPEDGDDAVKLST